MLTEADARKFAAYWVKAWNSHDVDAIMSHYASNVVLVSPAVEKLLQVPSGTLVGKDALRAYFERGLEAYPNLAFDLLDVLWGVSSIVLYYTNQKGTRTAEFMELDAGGLVCRVVANYNG